MGIAYKPSTRPVSPAGEYALRAVYDAQVLVTPDVLVSPFNAAALYLYELVVRPQYQDRRSYGR